MDLLFYEGFVLQSCLSLVGSQRTCAWRYCSVLVKAKIIRYVTAQCAVALAAIMFLKVSV
jgi:hypothetical protein